jgi:hypothetical protein
LKRKFFNLEMGRAQKPARQLLTYRAGERHTESIFTSHAAAISDCLQNRPKGRQDAKESVAYGRQPLAWIETNESHKSQAKPFPRILACAGLT